MKDIYVGAILGGVVTFVGQWLFYRYQKRDEKKQGPTAIVSKVIRDGSTLMEIRNTGSDSLAEMEIKIRWKENGQEKERQLDRFFLPDQNPMNISGTHIEILGPLDRYVISGIPQFAEEGVVDVHITGVGVNSQKIYNTASQLVVGLPPKN